MSKKRVLHMILVILSIIITTSFFTINFNLNKEKELLKHKLDEGVYHNFLNFTWAIENMVNKIEESILTGDIEHLKDTGISASAFLNRAVNLSDGVYVDGNLNYHFARPYNVFLTKLRSLESPLTDEDIAYLKQSKAILININETAESILMDSGVFEKEQENYHVEEIYFYHSENWIKKIEGVIEKLDVLSQEQ